MIDDVFCSYAKVSSMGESYSLPSRKRGMGVNPPFTLSMP